MFAKLLRYRAIADLHEHRCDRGDADWYVQGMFERTLMWAGARSCPLLWRCYVEAELYFGRPQAARRVFLRAIHECPGSQVGDAPVNSKA